jgi:hypothetical protein
MLADMQRTRILAWELPKLGWHVEIIAPAHGEVRQDATEPNPDAFFAPAIPLHEVFSGHRVFKCLRSLSVGWRTFWPMFWRGRKLLAGGQFDVIYFSTTMFPYFLLGPLWQRSSGVPYVLDFHDPWFAGHRGHSGWKWWLRKWLGLWMERFVVHNAAGLIAVSQRYIDTMRTYYGGAAPEWLVPGHHAVIPFAAFERDFQEAEKTVRTLIPAGDLSIHYVGAGGKIMARSFALVCRALNRLRQARHPLAEKVKVRLYGTTYDWKSGDPKILEDIARKYGVGDLVSESPGRVSYRRSLELLLECDGALILGVDDDGYVPSKLHNYALSGKPLLAALRRESPAFTHFEGTPALGHSMWFDQSAEMPDAKAEMVLGAFLQEAAARQTIDRQSILRPHMAPAMAQAHIELFEACISRERSKSKSASAKN